MSRALKRLGLTRKKTLYAAERDREDVVQARAQYRTDPLWQKPQTLIFFDESGVNLSFTRAHARAPRGHRAVGSVPKNWGDNVTLSGGLSSRGLLAPLMLRGSMNGAIFEAYIEQFVVPELRPGDVVIMDNLAAHKVKHVRPLIEATGARLVYLPPYSPDLSPIELAWSKVKAILRKLAARSYEQLESAVVQALGSIRISDAIGWFHHCGYRVVPE
jgi:transposase